MSDRAHRGAVPPDPTRQAAQRLLEADAKVHPTHRNAYVFNRADVRLVAEAVMAAQAAPVREGQTFEFDLERVPRVRCERCAADFTRTNGFLAKAECVAGDACPLREYARSAENAETCAKVDRDPTAAERAWAALWRAKARDLRIDGKRIYELFCAKHDSETDLLAANADLARREAALQAEVVRLREALEAAEARREKADDQLRAYVADGLGKAREDLIAAVDQPETWPVFPDLAIDEARAEPSVSGYGCTTDGSPFFPQTQCFVCHRFVGRDGHFSVDYFEMSSAVASVEAWHRECL